MDVITRTDATPLIPEDSVNEIIKTAEETSVIMRLGRRVRDMSTKQLRVPVLETLPEAYFVDSVNIGEAENVLKIADALGLKPDLNDQSIKDKTRAEVEAAIAKGVFGSPYIVVDGEPFWGMDRFEQLDRWMKAPF